METKLELTQRELDAISKRSTRLDAKAILAALNRACKTFEKGNRYEIRSAPDGYRIKLSYNKRTALSKGLLSMTYHCCDEKDLCSRLIRELEKYVQAHGYASTES